MVAYCFVSFSAPCKPLIFTNLNDQTPKKKITMISRLARTALKAKTSIPRTGSAFRSFHVSTPPQDDDKAAAVAEEDDSVGNDGVLGTLFGNPYYSVPLCGLGVMTATASDVSILVLFLFSCPCRKKVEDNGGVYAMRRPNSDKQQANILIKIGVDGFG